VARLLLLGIPALERAGSAPRVHAGSAIGRLLCGRERAYNGNISDDQTIQSVTFWAFVVPPVYEVAMAGDAVIFNLVEFWTGDQLLAIGPTVDAEGTWSL
jgi:hypothetical protein